MSKMTKGHFLTLVAKDTIVRTYGSTVRSWPDTTFWTLISTVKSSITEKQIPQLMASYKVTEFLDPENLEVVHHEEASQ